jgi:hypothetical protein
MRAKEFIIETGMHKMHHDHAAAIQNASTLPDQNMNTGSAYMNYRFGIALAGAPDYPTKAESWIGGDPLLSTYTEVEMDMIDYAAKQVGSSHAKRWSSKRSQEADGVQKTSPVLKKQKNKYGV